MSYHQTPLSMSSNKIQLSLKNLHPTILIASTKLIGCPESIKYDIVLIAISTIEKYIKNCGIKLDRKDKIEIIYDILPEIIDLLKINKIIDIGDASIYYDKENTLKIIEMAIKCSNNPDIVSAGDWKAVHNKCPCFPCLKK